MIYMIDKKDEIENRLREYIDTTNYFANRVIYKREEIIKLEIKLSNPNITDRERNRINLKIKHRLWWIDNIEESYYDCIYRCNRYIKLVSNQIDISDILEKLENENK